MALPARGQEGVVGAFGEHRAAGDVHRALGVGLLGGLAAHAAYGLTDAVALGAKPGFIFWLLLGLASALYARTTRGEEA